MKTTVVVALAGAALLLPPAMAQEAGEGEKLEVAAGDVVSRDQEPGKSFRVDPDGLPAPHATRSASNPPQTLAFAGQAPTVPDGFSASLVAKLEHPRRLLVLPNGDLVVAEQDPGHLTLVRLDADGKAELIEKPAKGFKQPYGLAWRDGEILVADQEGIWTLAHSLGGRRGQDKPAADATANQRKAPGGARQRLLTRKGVFGSVGGHVNRPLSIEPKTGALFVGVGSLANIGIEPKVKATIQRFQADGSGQTTFASGLRNPCGLTFHPETGELWAVVQERDGMGDRLVPDYLVHPDERAFYGWPYAYTGQHPQPHFADKAPEKVKASKAPDLLFEAHSSAMDLVFYDGGQFPPDYQGSAFVVLKGSWNRADPTGYKVVRVPFKNGRPLGSYENFMTGFWVSGRQRAQVWGRPAAIAVAKDGALLVADDVAGTIWRVAYQQRERRAESGAQPGEAR
jgi:glucose/arabinose dehydrogenase